MLINTAAYQKNYAQSEPKEQLKTERSMLTDNISVNCPSHGGTDFNVVDATLPCQRP